MGEQRLGLRFVRRLVLLVNAVAKERAKVLTLPSNVELASDSLRVKQVEQQVTDLRSSVICAFTQLLDLKDLNTGVHSTRLAEWGMRVGQELGLEESELQNLEVAALLHDIGKVGIPDAILRKPGRLDADEYTLMKKHPEYGWAVLRMLPGFERAALDILHHHENFDGKGYPAELKELEIPVVSRIVSVTTNQEGMGPGNGNPSADWQIIGPLKLLLRAEHVQDDRVYFITVQTTDFSGNSISRLVSVPVARTRGHPSH